MAMAGELLRHLFKKPVTLVYPFEKLPPVKKLRGRHEWDAEKCIGCGLCSDVCPAFAIELIGGRGKAFKGLKVYLDRCLFCAQCEEVCPRKAIRLTEYYEMAGYSRDDLVLVFKKEEAGE